MTTNNSRSSNSADKKFFYNTEVDLSRARTQAWVVTLPKDLYDQWFSAKNGAPLGSIEIIRPPKITEESTEAEKEEDNTGSANILVKDKSGSLATYRVDLRPTPTEDECFLLSEGSGRVKFAVEGRVDLNAMVYKKNKSEEKEEKKKEKDKKKKKKKNEDSIIVDPETEDADKDLFTTLPLQDKSEESVKSQRKIRGDKDLVKEEMLRIMQKKQLWSRQELAETLYQPMGMIDELIAECCEKVESDGSDSIHKKFRVLYRLKPYLRASTSSEPYQPPLKRSAP